LLDDAQSGISEPKGLVEDMQIGRDVRIIVGVDDGDGLPASRAR